ncbi:hypothetical protein Bca101_054746 [Brassica carinata]
MRGEGLLGLTSEFQDLLIWRFLEILAQCQGTSMIVHIKMNSQGEDTLFFVFKLHESCTLQAIASVIERETTEKKRKEMNGGLLDTLLVNAREYLDLWLSFECVDTEEICKIRLGDSEAGLRVLSE